MTDDEASGRAAIFASLVVTQFEALLQGRDPYDIPVRVHRFPPGAESWSSGEIMDHLHSLGWFPGLIKTPDGTFSEQGYTPREPSKPGGQSDGAGDHTPGV